MLSDLILSQSLVLRSAGVPNLAMSLLRTVTSGTPASLITVVVGDVLTTVLPGAKVSQSPLRYFLDRLETFWANLSSRDCSVRGMGFFSLGRMMNREMDLFLSPLYLLPASTRVFVIASLMRMSLRSPVNKPLSSRKSSTGTVSASK